MNPRIASPGRAGALRRAALVSLRRAGHGPEGQPDKTFFHSMNFLTTKFRSHVGPALWAVPSGGMAQSASPTNLS
jgi:hypothetical protein